MGKSRTLRLKRKSKIALVLSGGGVKAAAYHIGVCQALREKGFSFAGGNRSELPVKIKDPSRTFTIYVGSSAGALISAILAAGYSIESLVHAFEVGAGYRHHSEFKTTRGQLKPLRYLDMFRLNGKNITGNIARVLPAFLRHKVLVSGGIEALVKNGFKINGLFTTKGLEEYLRKHVLTANDFGMLNANLFITATQLNHSRKIIFGNFPETTKYQHIEYANFATISDAVAASVALPPVFAPYELKDEKGRELYCFDGGIRDTLSSHVAVEHGADLVIASYSVQPYHYTNDMGSLHLFGIPVIVNQALYQVIQQKIESQIGFNTTTSQIYRAVEGYFKENKLPAEHRDKILEIIRQRANFNPNVDYVYIHPSPNDYEMFFVDHFSLNPQILKRIARCGFKSAMNSLREFDL